MRMKNRSLPQAVSARLEEVVDAGTYWYSCLTVLPSGELGLLYEGDQLNIYFIKFSLEWIKGA